MPSVTGTSSLQYQQFVNFASADGVKSGTILASQKAQNGDLTIVAKTKGDFFGNIWRNKDTRDANDAIREAFKHSIVNLFGVTNEDQLPDSVKKAMKLDDYGKGKPLTARRILSVKTAVDNQLAGLAKAAQKSLSAYGITDIAGVDVKHLEKDAAVKERLATVIKTCGDDKEAFELIKSDMAKAIFGYDQRSRSIVLLSNDQVSAKVDQFIDKLNTLRARTGVEDKKMYNAMKPFLWSSDAADLTREQLSCMVTAVNDLDFGKLSNLKPDISKADLSRTAALNFEDMIEEAGMHSGVTCKIGEWKTSSITQMFASMIFAKGIPEGVNARELQTALKTMTAASRPMQSSDDVNASEIRLTQLKGLLDIYCDGPQAFASMSTDDLA